MMMHISQKGQEVHIEFKLEDTKGEVWVGKDQRGNTWFFSAKEGLRREDGDQHKGDITIKQKPVAPNKL